MHKRHGFTIVELLIVIVVIAILAAITVVAYNSIQNRAANAQQFATAKSYMTMFSAYVAANGAYPPRSSTRICLTPDSSTCSTSTAWVRDSQLETGLKTISNTLPVPSSSIPLVSSPKMAYIPTSDITLDGVANPFLIYTVRSPEVCTVGTPASGTWPSYSSSVPSQGYTAGEASGLRLCVIPLPLL